MSVNNYTIINMYSMFYLNLICEFFNKSAKK